MSSQVIGFYCLVAGLSMLAGWWTAFRNRPYLAFLGGFFLALAASLMIANRLEIGPRTEALRIAWWVAVGLAVALFGAALVAAVRESAKRWREAQEHYRAAAEAMVTMARAQEEKLRRQRAESGETPAAPNTDADKKDSE